MNTPYEISESSNLIEKLLNLTRDGKIEWTTLQIVPRAGEMTRQYFTPLEGSLEVSVWENHRAAGFRLIDKSIQEPAMRVIAVVPERDLLSISIDHEHDADLGPLYTMLMALLVLARRTIDKVEPKIDQVKQYLDKLNKMAV